MNTIKNFRSSIKQESVKFLKEKTDQVVKALSVEHHRLIQQFFDFKRDTQERLDKTDFYEKKFFDATYAFALKAPCYEASFAMNAKSALKLYDCMVPEIK